MKETVDAEILTFFYLFGERRNAKKTERVKNKMGKNLNYKLLQTS